MDLMSLLDDYGTEFPQLNENSTPAEAGMMGIEVFDGGKCYYYSDIKHYQYAEGVESRPMENAIMRNNIYSLRIKSISEIGHATIEPVVTTPIEDTKRYISVGVTILPWVVRFNDIDF